jgi:hypothetical protein
VGDAVGSDRQARAGGDAVIGIEAPGGEGWWTQAKVWPTGGGVTSTLSCVFVLAFFYAEQTREACK